MNTSLANFKHAGLGVRVPHVPALLDHPVEGLWLELLLDNWLYAGAIPQKMLAALAERYPLAAHGVGLSLGALQPLDMGYLASVKKTLDACDALVYSEHLSFSWLDTENNSTQFIPDLLPLPYTEEALDHLSSRINQVQDYLGRQMLIENISAYIDFAESEISEARFLTELAERTGCGLLLDVNNLYVNQINLGRDAKETLQSIPAKHIQEIHLAGFEQKEGFVIDAHNHCVADEVWELYQEALSLTGPVATLIEWDHDLPELDVLLGEVNKAQHLIDNHRKAA